MIEFVAGVILLLAGLYLLVSSVGGALVKLVKIFVALGLLIVGLSLVSVL